MGGEIHFHGHLAKVVFKIKIMKSYITTAIVAIFFLISAYFSLTAHNNHIISQKKLKVSTREVRLLKHQKKEMERKKRIMTRVSNFVNYAISSGLEKNRWAYYNVEIEQPATFPEVEQILLQTASTSSYYFKPMILHIKTDIGSNKNTAPNKSSSISADSKSTKDGDILLTLKGAIVIRHE